MSYYSVSFSYPTLRYDMDCVPEGEVSESSKALSKYDTLVEDTLKAGGYNVKHSYCWPDGSLYKYIESGLGKDELKKQLNKLFDETRIYVSDISERSPGDNPGKCHHSTLESYMRGIKDS